MSTCCLCFEIYESEINPAHRCRPCGHVMCQPCLQNWFRTRPQQTCPVCRSIVDDTVFDHSTMVNMDYSLDDSNDLDVTVDPTIFNPVDFQPKRNETLRDKCHYGFYVLDNSLSMEFYNDGTVYRKQEDDTIQEIRGVDRWQEATSKLLQIVEYNLCRGMPASYYLLNPSNKNNWQEGVDYLNIDKVAPNEYPEAIAKVKSVLCGRHVIRGNTPLDKMTRKFAETLFSNANSIRIPICYNIITDGEPNNKSRFVLELTRITTKYNIFLTINLCTNNNEIVEYYNSLDQTIGNEISGLDVIDDYSAEKKEVWDSGNRCFHYSMPIHICRMAGCYSVLADWMDEVPLDLHYINKLVRELTKESFDITLEHYLLSRNSFLKMIDSINQKFPPQWDIHTKSFNCLLSVRWLECLMIQKMVADFWNHYYHQIVIGGFSLLIIFASYIY